MATRFNYTGNVLRARTLAGTGARVLRWLQDDINHQQLRQGRRTLNFADGTKVTCTTVFGYNVVTIYSPSYEALWKYYHVEVLITVRAQYYIEVADPDFAGYHSQNGHKFYYLMPDFDRNYSDYIDEVIIADPGTPADIIAQATSAALNDAGIMTTVVNGIIIGLMRTSVESLQSRFPKSPDWPDGDAAWGRTSFREAKTFTVDDTAYVGYCSGILRTAFDPMSANIFDQFRSHVALKRKYHQFHILNGLFVWFGMEHEAEAGYPDWVNLNVKVIDITASGVNQLYEFKYFDYLDILGTTESSIFCDGPTPGNVLGYLRPPAYIDHIADVTTTSITIIAKAEHALGSLCGNHDYEDYGCGSGSYIQMTFNSAGVQTAGTRSFGFTDLVWGRHASSNAGAVVLADSTTDDVEDLTEDAYSVGQDTSINFSAGITLTSTRHIANQYIDHTIIVAGSPIQSKDHAWVLEADAEHTPRWTPAKLGANAFAINEIDFCAYLKILREYTPAMAYSSHVGYGPSGRYCSSGYSIWNSGYCNTSEHYDQRTADGGSGSLVSGHEWEAPPPDYWYSECTFGKEIAEYVDLPLDHTGTWSCSDTYALCHEKYALCVSEEFEQHVPRTISFRVDMQNLDSPFMQSQSWYGINPPADANEMETRLGGPEDTAWGSRSTDANANNELVNDANGAVEKIWTEPGGKVLDTTLVYFETHTKKYPRVWEGNKLFWENYNFAYAFLDNRAIDNTALVFVGHGQVDPEDDNYDILLGWTIDLVIADVHTDITAAVFSLANITDPTQLLDMGIV